MRTLVVFCFALTCLHASAFDFVYLTKLSDLRQQVTIDTVSKVLNYTDGLPDEGTDNSFWYAYDAKNCIYRKAGYRSSLSSDFKTSTLDANDNVKELKLNSFDRNSIKYSSYDLRYPIGGKVTKRVVVMADGRDIFSTEGVQPDRIAKGWSLIYSKYCDGAKKEF